MGKFKILISFFILFLMFGCVTIPQKDASSDAEKNKVSLIVAPILKFDDIPVPSGFVILDKESFAFQNDRNRVALLKYIGPKPADQVVAFYKDQMSLYNWDMINIIEYEKKVLNYENSEESCIVTVEPRGSKSAVTIALSPKSRPIRVEKKEKD